MVNGRNIMSQTKTIRNGVIHGRTIELESETGFPDGQAVSVIVQPVVSPVAFSS